MFLWALHCLAKENLLKKDGGGARSLNTGQYSPTTCEKTTQSAPWLAAAGRALYNTPGQITASKYGTGILGSRIGYSNKSMFTAVYTDICSLILSSPYMQGMLECSNFLPTETLQCRDLADCFENGMTTAQLCRKRRMHSIPALGTHRLGASEQDWSNFGGSHLPQAVHCWPTKWGRMLDSL